MRLDFFILYYISQSQYLTVTTLSLTKFLYNSIFYEFLMNKFSNFFDYLDFKNNYNIFVSIFLIILFDYFIIFNLNFFVLVLLFFVSVFLLVLEEFTVILTLVFLLNSFVYFLFFNLFYVLGIYFILISLIYFMYYELIRYMGGGH